MLHISYVQKKNWNKKRAKLIVAVMEMWHFDLPSKKKVPFFLRGMCLDNSLQLHHLGPPAAFELRPCSLSGKPQTMTEHNEILGPDDFCTNWDSFIGQSLFWTIGFTETLSDLHCNLCQCLPILFLPCYGINNMSIKSIMSKP